MVVRANTQALADSSLNSSVYKVVVISGACARVPTLA